MTGIDEVAAFAARDRIAAAIERVLEQAVLAGGDPELPVHPQDLAAALCTVDTQLAEDLAAGRVLREGAA